MLASLKAIFSFSKSLNSLYFASISSLLMGLVLFRHHILSTSSYSNTASGLNLKTDDNNIRIKVTDTGIVGIGTETPSVSLHINHTDAIKIPKGTTAERPTATGAEHTGYIRYNSTLNQ